MKTKPTQSSLFLLLASLAVTGCGKLDSALNSTKRSVAPGLAASLSASAVAPLSAEDFAKRCLSENGALEKNNSICINISHQKFLPDSNGLSTASVTDLEIGGSIAPGSLVQAIGTVEARSVQVYLNGALLTDIPTPNPVFVGQGGRLSFRIRLGKYSGVGAAVYACRNKYWQFVPCN